MEQVPTDSECHKLQVSEVHRTLTLSIPFPKLKGVDKMHGNANILEDFSIHVIRNYGTHSSL